MSDEAGSKELFEAIRAGDTERALAIVRANPVLAGARDAEALSATMQALYHDKLALAEELGRLAGQLDIFEAAALGDLERMSALATDPSAVNAWSPDGFTPLHLAAFFGHAEEAQLLIDRGADVEAQARNRTFADEAHPLHSAVAARRHETVRVLLDAGADPDAKQHGGYTALLQAAQAGDVAIVDLLLEHGADAQVQLEDGRSPAEVARHAGHRELAERLGS